MWEAIDDTQVVVWLDNFYRRRHGTDPQQDDLLLNVSVLTILATVDLIPFPGHPPLQDVAAGLPRLASRISGMVTEILHGVSRVTEQPLQASWIRVPLDIRRPCLLIFLFEKLSVQKNTPSLHKW